MSNGSTEHWVKQGVPEPVAKTLAGKARDVAKHPATIGSGSTIGALVVAFQLLGDKLPSKAEVQELKTEVKELRRELQLTREEFITVRTIVMNRQDSISKRYE